MDNESGDDNRDELTSEWGRESRRDWRGWPNESGSWFQRRGDAYLNERSVIFNEEMVGGREREMRSGYCEVRGGWTETTHRLTSFFNKHKIHRNTQKLTLQHKKIGPSFGGKSENSQKLAVVIVAKATETCRLTAICQLLIMLPAINSLWPRGICPPNLVEILIQSGNMNIFFEIQYGGRRRLGFS